MLSRADDVKFSTSFSAVARDGTFTIRMTHDVPAPISVDGAKAVFRGEGVDVVGKRIDVLVDGRSIVSDRVRIAGQITFHPPLELELGKHVIVVKAYPFDDGLSASGFIELDITLIANRTACNSPAAL